MRGIVASAAIALALLAPAAPALPSGPVVLFDEGHGQRFLAGNSGQLDLSGLAGLFHEAGMEVRVGRGRLSAEALRGVGALVISGPFAPIAPDEAEAVRAFLAAGGRLALMLHIPQPFQALLDGLGIQHSRAPVHETAGLIGGRDLDFTVTAFHPHPLTEGLRAMSVFGCWALKNNRAGASEIARTGEMAWVDVDGNRSPSPGDPVGTYAVVVAGALEKGAYAVFGDDAIFQNRFLESHNRDLGRRLARWLAGAGALPSPAPPAGVKL